MEPKVVFEDKWILVVEKPSGMVTVRVKTVKEKTVQDWVESVLAQFIARSKGRGLPARCRRRPGKSAKTKRGDFYQRAGIVHRLDKETSGLLLVAKTPEAFANLQKQFKERKVKKKYLALVYGKVAPKEGEIRVPVGRLTGKGIRFGVRPGGKEARTRYHVSCIMYHVSEKKRGEYFSLLEVFPRTGRTHQIRVHLKYFGHPIVADLKYGGKRAKKDRQWCPRLFLHAAYLEFSHPQTGKWMEFKVDLPEDLRGTLDLLKN